MKTTKPSSPTLLVVFLAFCFGCGEEPSVVVPQDDPAEDVQSDTLRDRDLGTEQDSTPLLPDTNGDDAADEDVGSEANLIPPVAVAGADVTTRSGAAITFDASESFDPDGNIVQWEWSFGDGTQADGEIAFYTYVGVASYVVRLTVTDDDGLTSSDSLEVHIEPANEGPNAVIVGPLDVILGDEASYHGRNSSDDDGITSFVWDVDVITEDPISGANLDYTWDAWGDYDLSLTVEDADGETDGVVHFVRVLSPPTAVITADTSVELGDEITLSGADSFDDDGEIVAYFWQFPDGSTQAVPVPRYTFLAEGEVDVVLTVTDNDGLTGTATLKFFVEPPPNVCPVAVIDTSGLSSWQTLEDVAVSATESTDSDGDVVGWIWNWGDGSDPEVGETLTHQYADGGEYTITLSVADDMGCIYFVDDPLTESARTSVNITIENRDPVAILAVEPNPGTVGEEITFSGTLSGDLDGSIVSYTIAFGDGFSTPVVSADHSYATAGSYEAVLAVRDDDDAVNEHTVTVVVEDETTDYDYTGTWLLFQRDGEEKPVVQYVCLIGFIDISFTTVELLDSDGTAAGCALGSVASCPDDQPGLMTGSFSDADTFSITRTYPGGGGGCTETYTLAGTFESENSLIGTFSALYSGSACAPASCFDQVWLISGSRLD